MGRGGHNGLYAVTAVVSAVNGPAYVAETITCTPEHPLFVQGQGWVEAGSLGIGTSLVSRAGPALQVTDLTWEKNKAEELAAGTGSSFGGYTVYNLTVEDDHTFFVGSAGGGTWVHDVDCLNELERLRPDEKFPHYQPNPQEGAYTRLRFEEDGNTINSAQTYDSEGFAESRTDFLSRSGRTDHGFPHYHQMDWTPGARNPGGSPAIGQAMTGFPP